jgi:hypothetical protein
VTKFVQWPLFKAFLEKSAHFLGIVGVFKKKKNLKKN